MEKALPVVYIAGSDLPLESPLSLRYPLPTHFFCYSVYEIMFGTFLPDNLYMSFLLSGRLFILAQPLVSSNLCAISSFPKMTILAPSQGMHFYLIHLALLLVLAKD